MAKIVRTNRCTICDAKINSGRLCNECEAEVKDKAEELIPLDRLKIIATHQAL